MECGALCVVTTMAGTGASLRLKLPVTCWDLVVLFGPIPGYVCLTCITIYSTHIMKQVLYMCFYVHCILQTDDFMLKCSVVVWLL